MEHLDGSYKSEVTITYSILVKYGISVRYLFAGMEYGKTFRNLPNSLSSTNDFKFF